MFNNYWFIVFTAMHLVTFCVGFVVYGMHFRARVAARRAYIWSVKWCAGIGAGVCIVSVLRHAIDLFYIWGETIKW